VFSPGLLADLAALVVNTGNIAAATGDTIPANLTSIEEVIANLKLICGSGGSRGCTPGGTQPPQPPYYPEAELPEGMIYPIDENGDTILPGSAAHFDRKCKVINAVVQLARDFLQQCADSPIIQPALNFALTVMIQILINVFTVMIAAIDGPLWLMDIVAAFGWLYFERIAISFAAEGVDLQQLVDDVNDNIEDIVCAMYGAGNSLSMVLASMEVLENAGTSDPNLSVWGNILSFDILNYAWLQRENAPEQWEQELRDYVALWPCDDCSCYHQIGYGTVLEDTGSVIVLQSKFQDAFHRASIRLCGSHEQEYTFSGFAVTAGTVTPVGTSDLWRIASPAFPTPSGFHGDIYSSNTFPSGSYPGAAILSVTSSTPFTLQFNYAEDA
jgi:hypothetical protein